MIKKYEFQIENGHLYEGGDMEIAIVDHIAEIKGEITPALQLLIDAHGGFPVIGPAIEEAKSKPRKGRRVKPVKW